MLSNSKPFNGFTVDDLAQATKFYTETLGLSVTIIDESNGLANLRVADRDILIYQKSDHEPATYTMLNFPVSDVEGAVDELAARGVRFEKYFDGQDDKGINRAGGPLIAWFKDPAGNVLSVIEAE